MNRIFGITLLIYLFLPILYSHAQFSIIQKNQIDSLELLIENPFSHDSSKAAAYLNLSEIYSICCSDTVVPLCEMAAKLSEENLSGKRRKVEEITAFKKILSGAFNNIGTIHNSKGELGKAIEYYNKSLRIYKEISDKSGIAITLNNLAYVSKTHGDKTTAIDYYFQSLNILTELDDKKGMATATNNLGYIFRSMGEIPKALDFFSRSLKYREAIDDKFGIANSFNAIGYIYDDQGDLLNARKYFFKGLFIRREIGDKIGIATSLHNLGLINKKMGNYALAKIYFMESLKLREFTGNKDGVGSSLNYLGNLLEILGDSSTALNYYFRSLKIMEELNNKQGMANTLNSMARLLFNQHKYKEAEGFAIRSLKISNDLGYPEYIKDDADILTKIYKAEKKFQIALKTHELFIQMKDSFDNEVNKKSIMKQQYKYEYEKRALSDSIRVSEEKKVITVQLRNEETKRYGLYVGLGIVILFSAFIFHRLKITRNQKSLIELQKNIMDKKNIEIEKARELIEEKHKEVTDSIRYAKRIQIALLPNENYIKKKLDKLIK